MFLFLLKIIPVHFRHSKKEFDILGDNEYLNTGVIGVSNSLRPQKPSLESPSLGACGKLKLHRYYKIYKILSILLLFFNKCYYYYYHCYYYSRQALCA